MHDRHFFTGFITNAFIVCVMLSEAIYDATISQRGESALLQKTAMRSRDLVQRWRRHCI